jgi:hypothetical protein
LLTIGIPVYSPSADFNLMRSYLPQVSVSGVLGTPTVVDNHIFWINQHGSGQDYHIFLNHKFWLWNAGRWSITDTIDECYYQVPPNPTKNPVIFDWQYKGHANSNGASMLWIPYGSLTTPIYIPLPAAAQPYWWNGDQA